MKKYIVTLKTGTEKEVIGYGLVHALACKSLTLKDIKDWTPC